MVTALILAGAFTRIALASETDSLLSRVEALEVADEDNEGYDRELFRYDSEAMRAVLIEQERTPEGWYSLWDGRTHVDTDTLDVDHTVALAEAWGSGASEWDPGRLKAFANDVSSPYTLNLITRELNRGAKSDNDPFDWMPAVNQCEYVKQWTAVKLQWGLTADGEEKMRLASVAAGCDAAPKAPAPEPEATTSVGPEPTQTPTDSPVEDQPPVVVDSGGDLLQVLLLGFGLILIGCTISAYAMLRKGKR